MLNGIFYKSRVKIKGKIGGKIMSTITRSNWRNVELSRKRRVQLKESAKGLPFKEYFHYLNKQYNFFTAIAYSLIPYIRILLKK